MVYAHRKENQLLLKNLIYLDPVALIVIVYRIKIVLLSLWCMEIRLLTKDQIQGRI